MHEVLKQGSNCVYVGRTNARAEHASCTFHVECDFRSSQSPDRPDRPDSRPDNGIYQRGDKLPMYDVVFRSFVL